MLTKEEFERYQRQLALPNWDETAQQKLKEAKVLVIGAGGLGCPVLAYLAAAGIGKLGIADFDQVEVSNLQRQILYDMNDLNEKKALAAARKLQQFNPLIQITAHTEGFTKENAIELARQYDLIVDGSDNFETRYLVNDVCVMLEKPFVYGSIQGFEGQLSVFNFQDGPTYRCLFPEAPQNVPSCDENGVIGALPGIVGSLQATEVIKILSGIGEPLSGKLLCINLLKNQFRTFAFKANPESKQIALQQAEDLKPMKKTGVQFISREEYKQQFSKLEHTSIDVSMREEEFTPLNEKSRHIPLYEIEYEELDEQLPVVVYCKNGVSSKQAALLLVNRGCQEVYCLK
jgi:sulfur-carrier protein adenylyltransferase/sulfurtransferase